MKVGRQLRKRTPAKCGCISMMSTTHLSFRELIVGRGRGRNTPIFSFVAIMVVLLGPNAAAQISPSQAAPPQSETAPSVQGASPLNVSPAMLDFGTQVVDLISPVRTIILTAGPGARVKVSYSQPTGDFAGQPNSCDLEASASCAIAVTFAPKQVGESFGSITISVSNAQSLTTKVIALMGRGVASYGPQRDILSKKGFISFLPVMAVICIYVGGLILARWNMISLPTRRLLREQIEADKQRVETLSQIEGKSLPGMGQITALLTEAEKLIKDKWGATRMLDCICWTRGQELAGWSYVHEAEKQMVFVLPVERVRASMECAETDLRQVATPVALGLADRIHAALSADPNVSIERWRALLAEALGFLFDRTDGSFADLVSWHNKTVWLISCGLLLIASLAAVLGHEVLFIVGATGGLLSRLSRSLYREDVPTDYGAYWTTLFLSPVVGALAGWSGVLLAVVGINLNVVGSAIKIDWCNPYSPIALGAALLLGFSERAFTGILSQLEDKVKGQPTVPPLPQPAVLTIATVSSLPNANVGQEYKQSLVASGGKPPYTWTRVSGSMPAGLDLALNGQIGGIPSAEGSFKFTLQVSDAASRIKIQEFAIEVGQRAAKP